MESLRICENCEFLLKKEDLYGKKDNVCILDDMPVGLLHTCTKFKRSSGEHITKE